MVSSCATAVAMSRLYCFLESLLSSALSPATSVTIPSWASWSLTLAIWFSEDSRVGTQVSGVRSGVRCHESRALPQRALPRHSQHLQQSREAVTLPALSSRELP